MRALRCTLLLPVVLLGCVPDTEDLLAPPCPQASVQVGTPPVFNWPSICGVSVLQVSAVNNRSDIKWSIATPDLNPDIHGPVTYGEVPAGLTEGTPAVALVSGVEYRVNLLVVVNDVGSTIASVRFTQP